MKLAKKMAALFLAAAMTILAGFSGLSEAKAADAETTQSVRIGFGYDASTLDSGMCTDDASAVPVKHCNEALLRNHNGVISAGIAETWEASEDGLEWTFHLRQSTYSDGTPVTANDFAYGLKRLMTPENALDRASDTSSIVGAAEVMEGEGSIDEVGIEVVDDYTLKLTFINPQFESDFTGYCYYPVNQAMVESCGEAYGAEAENIIGNGPFMVQSWTHDSEIVMVKNPNYWNADAVKLDEIHFLAGASAETAVDMMSTDMLDICSFSNLLNAEAVLDLGGFEMEKLYNGAQFLHINSAGKTEETGKWLSNVNFRKALCYAIDRNALVSAVYTSDTAADRLVPGSEAGVNGLFNEEYDYGNWSASQDVELAKQYLAAAMEELGVSDVSEIPTLTFLAYDSQGNINCLNAVADMWDKALGIKIELDMETISEMISKAYSGDFDFWKGGVEINRDAMDMLDAYSSTYGSGIYGYDDPEYEVLFQNVLDQSDWAARKAAISELAAYWTENMMDLEVTWIGNYQVYKDTIQDIGTDGSYIDLTYASVQG